MAGRIHEIRQAARETSEQAVLDACREAGVRVLREAWGL
jgi:hypothetical protein